MILYFQQLRDTIGRKSQPPPLMPLLVGPAQGGAIRVTAIQYILRDIHQLPVVRVPAGRPTYRVFYRATASL